MKNTSAALRTAGQKQFLLLAALVLACSTFIFLAAPARAATLTSASLNLGDPRPSATTVTYDFQASGVSLSAIKCIKVVFATTVTGSTVPTSLSTASAALSGASDYIPTPGSWSVNNSTNGTVLITFGTGETPASASGRNVVLSGITNGSTADTPYYVQFSTFNNTDCSTSAVDSVTASFIFTSGQQVSLTIDPALSFTVGAVAGSQSVNGATTTVASTTTTIPFGTVTTGANAIAAQDLTVNTNASGGYTVNVRYTGAPSNGSAAIDDHTGSNTAPSGFPVAGNEAFGYTTNDTSLGTGTANRFSSNLWAAAETTNREVAFSNAPVSNQITRVGYQVGIAGVTPSGTYNSTVIYTATPIY